MLDLATYFGLGNAAILTNACMLPLYPGMIAFLAGNANDERHRRATGWLGLLVLAGVLTMMIIIGVILYVVQLALGDALMILLPLIYAAVIVLGILMLTGRNPFARLATAQLPLMKNPYVAAYVYGLMFGPMTLPCTGPIITGALLVGAGSAPMLG
ncbi:MAG: cytochrome c biogenesis protein CcdA, partial [Chloroflexota bacterium]|nr:cytochrome c biogenesis protein CcdA [Chloroflexota bacterium]